MSLAPPAAPERRPLAIAGQIAVVVLIAVTVFAYRYVTFGGFTNDHYVHLARAQQWLFGEWPVRDFVDPGLPLMEGLSVAAQLAFGRGLFAELLLVCATFAAAAALTYVAAARVTGSLAAGVLAALLPVLVYPLSYGYPKLLLFSAALAVAPLDAGDSAARRISLLGLIAGLAFLFRHDLGVILAIAVTIAIVVQHGRSARKPILRFALTGFVIAAPFLLWVQTWQGVAAYFSDGLTFSQREAAHATWQPPRFVFDAGGPLTAPVETGGACGPRIHVKWAASVGLERLPDLERRHRIVRRDPAGPQTWDYEVCDVSRAALHALVTDAAVADTQGIDRERFTIVGQPGLLRRWMQRLPSPGEALHLTDNAVALLFYVAWLTPIVAGAILIARRRVQPPPMPLVMAVVMQLLMNATMLRDPLNNRVRDVLVPVAVMLVWVATWLWRREGAGRSPRRAFAALVVVTATLAAAIVGDVPECLRNANLDQGFRAMVVRAGEIRQEFAPPLERTGRLVSEYQAIVTYLSTCLPEGSRLLAMGFHPDLVFHVGHGFAAGLPTLTADFYTSDRDQRRMLDRLAKQDVPFVVLDTEQLGAMRHNFPMVMAHVDARYREAARFTRGGTLTVLAEAGRRSSRTFGPDTLPCFTMERGA